MIYLRKELSEKSSSLLTLELDESIDLKVQLASLEKDVFDSSVEIKRNLSPFTPPPIGSLPFSSDSTRVKLPKLDVPTFDGNILNWRSLWEQFCVSVCDLTTRSGDNYSEAVQCLQARFDRPRLIHQPHVHMISEAPALKDGTGNELRGLHDTARQYLRALKAMGYEPPGPFITSLMELN